MRTKDELIQRLSSYQTADYIYLENVGHIAWHVSTGENIEVLFIETIPGYGVVLYQRFLEELVRKGKEPYHSLFCYMLASNTRARRFYERMGWHLIPLGQSIYRGDGTVLAWITWKDFLAKLGANL